MKSFTKITAHFFLFLSFSPWLSAQQNVTPLIRIDQFGYMPASKKVAVIADPQVGFNAAASFTPGNTLQVRRASTGQTVFSAAPQPWKNGATHEQSGDKGWWLDFSAVTEPGDYYLFDPSKGLASYTFRIADDVYLQVLKQAVRTFFYQRIGFAKQPPYADAKWTDNAAFEGPDQDPEARNRWEKNDPSSARDLHGGWMDAGDVNKYTTFAEGAVIQLLSAYARNPNVFTDDYGIPESGNGIPDLLDEVIWELDWLKRMQDATGTNGFLLKNGVDNFNDVSPPSADTRPRYYLPECTSATLAGCAIFAKAGYVFQQSGIADLQDYAADLIQRAQAAWDRAKVTTQNYTFLETECDDLDIKANYADRSEIEQMESAVTAAVYLYAATGISAYKDFAEGRYNTVRPYLENWWPPYRMHISEALLELTQLPNVYPAIIDNIRAQKSNMNEVFSLGAYTSQEDLYLAFMDDWAHHWGSNQVRANCGTLNMDFVHYNINPNRRDEYRELAEQYLHWLHGTNPLGMCMLSNMYANGGDYCVNEIYHTWFGDNTPWDNALASPKGPPPGYLTGGPNINFSLPEIAPPANQPPQKAYKDWNTGWPENSWEITEPAIYYQAAYVLLLANLLPDNLVGTDTPLGAQMDFSISPNPFTASFDIRFETPEPGSQWAVEILNLTGKRVGVHRVNAGSPTTLDFPAGFPAGAYIAVLLKDGAPVGRKKITRF